MKDHLVIPFANHPFDSVLIDEVSELLNSTEKNSINFAPWHNNYPGKADFSIAYSEDAVLLKFFVVEESILARFIEPNDPVYRDSCVEFFIAFGDDDKYYNFEFNCKGNCLGGYGPGKLHREIVPSALIRAIKTTASFKTVEINGKSMINWELTIVIPNIAFHFHHLPSLNNKIARVNFYKCGDDLPEPHYLCWKPVIAVQPNFHLPEFFGNAFFKEN